MSACEDEGYGDRSLVAELKTEGYAVIARINGYIAYLQKSRQGAER